MTQACHRDATLRQAGDTTTGWTRQGCPLCEVTWGVCPSQSGKYTVPKRVAFVSDLESEVAVGRKRREPGKRDSRPRHVIHGPEPRVPRKPLAALALRFGGFGTFPFGIECDAHHSLSDRCPRHHHNTTATYQVCLAHLCPECRLAQCRFCLADGAHARPRQAIRFYGHGPRRTATHALFVAVVKFFFSHACTSGHGCALPTLQERRAHGRRTSERD